jgi:hypothetical protein
MDMKKLSFAVLSIVFLAGIALAEAVPAKLSLWNKIAVPPSDSVIGLELGIGSYTPEVTGVSWNIVYSRTDNITGWECGFFTVTKDITGAQTGFINFNEGNITGLQWGFFNKARSVKGVQIGFVNMTETMYGVQIGLVNFIKTGKLPVMVIANANF